MSKSTNQDNESSNSYQKELFYQNTSDLMLFLDPLGRIIDINKAGIDFSGFKFEEMIGNLFWKMPGVFSKRNIPKYLNVFKNSLLGKCVKDFQCDLTDKSGKKHVMNFSTFPITENKKVKKILVIGTDITNLLEIEKSLKKTKDLYRLITDNTSDLIATIKFDSTYTFLSPSHKRVMGYEPEELLNKKGFEFIHPDDKKKIFVILRKYITAKGKKIFTGKDSDISENVVYRAKHKDGSWRYLSSTINLIENEILLVSKDITEMKLKTEKDLQESEEKFKNLAENSPNIIFIHKNNNIVYVNKISEVILGYKREEIYKPDFDFIDLISPEFHDLVKKYMKKHDEGKEISSFEYTLLTKNNRRINAILTTKRIKFDGENAVLGILTDITERKKNEEKTKNLKDHLQKIIDSASEFIVSFDLNNNISSWNKTAEQITGYKKSEVIGRSIFSFDVFENIDKLVNFQKKLYSGESRSFIEIILNPKSGSKRIIRSSSSIMSGDNSEPIGIIFIGSDITKEIEMHGKLFNGNSYIIIDKDNRSAIELLSDLTSYDFKGLFISRDKSNIIDNRTNKSNVKTILLSQDRLKGFENISSLDDLENKIVDFIKKSNKSVVLLDRIDYLITIFSFDSVIISIYKIVNIISKYNAIMLVRCNPSVLSDSQLALLKEELISLPSQSISDIQLEETFFDILDFIYRQYKNNIIVTYSKIGKAFSITKVTVAKRLYHLRELDLIFIKKQGREKIVHISEKGISLLNKRRAI